MFLEASRCWLATVKLAAGARVTDEMSSPVCFGRLRSARRQIRRQCLAGTELISKNGVGRDGTFCSAASSTPTASVSARFWALDRFRNLGHRLQGLLPAEALEQSKGPLAV